MKPISPLPMRRRVLVIALAAAFASGAAFAEPMKVVRRTELRATPVATAEVLAELKEKDDVDLAAIQGAWANVTTAAGVAGWTRVLNLGSAAGGSSGNRSGGGASALFAAGSSNPTATTGAKGLNSNELMNASPDLSELSELDGLAANASDARSFAGQAPLQAQQVAYLPEGRGGRRSR